MATGGGTAGSSGSSTFQTITEDHKRWLVFGIALNHVLVPLTRSFLEQEIQKEYNNLKVTHKIHIQTTRSHLPKYPGSLNYKNINSNDKRRPFDWKITSHLDFAKLSLENYMAKFNAFDEHCDASAVLTLLGKIPVFSKDVQDAANVVRRARNSWAHCTFTDWGEHDFEQRFIAMEDLTKKLGLPSADESKILMNLNDWKMKGVLYIMNATVDSDLANLIQQHVNSLKDDVNKLVFDREEEEEAKKKMERALEDVLISVKELDKRVANVESNVRKLERGQEAMEQQLSSVSVKVDENPRQMNEMKAKQDTTKISCGSGKKQVRISELFANDYQNICRYLNVRNSGKDYKELAGKMGYTMQDVKEFDLEKNPTGAILSNWETESGNTVDKLIEILKSMENDVAAEKLEQAKKRCINRRI